MGCEFENHVFIVWPVVSVTQKRIIAESFLHLHSMLMLLETFHEDRMCGGARERILVHDGISR